ncbi:MAG: (Fe-S)-binding protein [Pseudomonadota bacterium]
MATNSEKNKERETVLKSIAAIKNGPVPMRVAMEICARCGTCAQVCPVYQGKQDARYNPVLRTDRIRRIYRKHNTTSGKMLGGLAGAEDYRDGEIKEWAEVFYECTGCRRCAVYCPMGIDHSVLTRKGRAIVHALNLTPQRLLDVTDVSLKTGNTDGCTPEGFVDTIKFLEEEMKEETGIDIPIPIDKEKADVFFVPPSGDVLVKPEALMGLAKIFYHLDVDWTTSSKFFDGANYGLFTGDDKAMKDENKQYVDEAKKIGCKTMMMGECGHAYRIMKFMMEKARWWGELPFDIVNCMEYTADVVKAGRIELDKSKNPQPVTYHDPCNFGRSCGIIEEPRLIMRAACEDYREMTPSGAENWCCGGGGGLSAMDTIREFRMTVTGIKKLEQIKATGAKFVASPCANCKRQLTQLMEHYDLDVEIGGVHDMVSRAIVLKDKSKKKTK